MPDVLSLLTSDSLDHIFAAVKKYKVFFFCLINILFALLVQLWLRFLKRRFPLNISRDRESQGTDFQPRFLANGSP